MSDEEKYKAIEQLNAALALARHHTQAVQLIEEALAPLARKIGLRIKVIYDELNFGYYIDCAMIPPPRATHTIDASVFLRQPAGSKALVDLMTAVLEDLQGRTFDATAKKMSELDFRGKQYGLSKADKHTLNDMFMDACNERLRDFSRADYGVKKTDEYQALMSRLHR